MTKLSRHAALGGQRSPWLTWCALACAAPAAATPEPEVGVETIVVTDSAPSDSIELVPGGATLIDGESLKQRNVATLADLLRYVPGVWSASTHGSDGTFISSRGSNLDATDYDMNGILLLQDGLPVTAADGNNHNRVLDPLSARFATIARGANAVRYGASTLGGAIDFKSPTARDSAPREIYASAGSHGQLLARGTLGTAFPGGADALLTLESKRWDGYREHNEQRREGVYANFGWQATPRVDTRWFLTYVDNEEELPGALTRAQLERDASAANPAALSGDYALDVTTLRLASTTTLRLAGGGELDFGLSLEQQSLFHPIVDVRVDPDGAGPASPVRVFSLLVDTDHDNAGATLRYARRSGAHELAVGLHHARSGVTGGDFSHDGGVRDELMTAIDNSAATTTLFALDRWQLSRDVLIELGAQAVAARRDVLNVDASSGARRNPRGRFSRVNPRAGVIFAAGRDVDLFANVSALYEPPTTYELEDEVTGGGAVLDAMRGKVLEVGTRGRRALDGGKRLQWEAALYRAEIDNEILSTENPAAPGTSLTTNAGATVHAGLEASFAAELPLAANRGTLAPQLSLTLNDFSFDGDPVYGDNALPAAPRYALRGELLYRHPRGFYVGPTFDVVGTRFADFANAYRIDSYELLGVRAGFAAERWQVFAEAVNVRDERYAATLSVRTRAQQDAAILNPGAPRSFYVGLQARF